MYCGCWRCGDASGIVTPRTVAAIYRACAEGADRDGEPELAARYRDRARRAEFRDGWRHEVNRNDWGSERSRRLL
jgi:hypothetical protein